MSNYKLLRHQYKQIECYKEITKDTTPHPQLLRLIDFDNTLEKELGVSLESYTPEDIHALLLSSIDSDHLNTLALEDLASNLTSAANWSGKFLKDGILGFIRGKIAAGVVLGSIAIGKILLGKIKQKTKKVTPDHVTSLNDYKYLITRYDKLESIFSTIVNHIPDSFHENDWISFNERYSKDSARRFTDLLVKEVKKYLKYLSINRDGLKITLKILLIHSLEIWLS